MCLSGPREAIVRSTVRYVCSPGHVSAAGDDLVVVEEPAAAQVAGVAGQLAADAHVALARLQAASKPHFPYYFCRSTNSTKTDNHTPFAVRKPILPVDGAYVV